MKSLDDALDEAAEFSRGWSLHYLVPNPVLKLKLPSLCFLKSSSLANDINEKLLTGFMKQCVVRQQLLAPLEELLGLWEVRRPNGPSLQIRKFVREAGAERIVRIASQPRLGCRDITNNLDSCGEVVAPIE